MSLHDKISSELDRLTALAEAATPWKDYSGNDDEPFQIQYGDFGPGIVGTPMGEWEDSEQGRRDAAFARSVANPADALRRYAAARRVLERHRRIGGFEYCVMCSLFADDGSTVLLAAPYPCPDVVDLAASLGIEVSP